MDTPRPTSESANVVSWNHRGGPLTAPLTAPGARRAAASALVAAGPPFLLAARLASAAAVFPVPADRPGPVRVPLPPLVRAEPGADRPAPADPVPGLFPCRWPLERAGLVRAITPSRSAR